MSRKSVLIKKSIRIFISLLVIIVSFFLTENFDSIDKTETSSLKIFKVIDGDTVHLKQNQEIIKVRLIGVDTPESSENDKAFRDAYHSKEDVKEIVAMGKESKRFLSTLLQKNTDVTLELGTESKDKYNRTLGYLYLDNGNMVNETILREGFGMVVTFPPNVKYVEKFKSAMEYAIRNQNGLWGDSLNNKVMKSLSRIRESKKIIKASY